jgi:hypothetical protein
VGSGSLIQDPNFASFSSAFGILEMIMGGRRCQAKSEARSSQYNKFTLANGNELVEHAMIVESRCVVVREEVPAAGLGGSGRGWPVFGG